MRGSARGSEGFTLLEVMVALSLLAVTALGMASLAGSLVHTSSDGRLAAEAAAAADARVSLIQVWPNYDTVDSAYKGTEANTPFSGWTRVTTVKQITSDSNDYKKFTVSVTGPGLTTAVTRSITVANQ
jgi:prepilin-type N-terminal cleavage/methylation domain-containing protein